MAEEKKIKSLEEILAEIIESPHEPLEPRFDESDWITAMNATDEIIDHGNRILNVCKEEQSLLSERPYLIHGPYLRDEFVERISEVLLEAEEMVYIKSRTMQYDPFETGQYINTCKRKNCKPVSIHISDDRILIRMPYLPGKYNGTIDICNQMLASKIFHTNNFPTWFAWQANYYHIFPEATSDIPKDVDNYAYKRTNDIIAYALGSCDNALRFSMSMTTVFTDKLAPGTYIEIVQKSSENIDFIINAFSEENL